MRDHPDHTAAIMAGMWGAKLSPSVQSDMRVLFLKLLSWPDILRAKQADLDQYLLEKYLWPVAKGSVCQHDSYNCRQFNKVRPWPTRRRGNKTGNFVGARFALNETLNHPCPIQCRPKHHKNWSFCWNPYLWGILKLAGYHALLNETLSLVLKWKTLVKTLSRGDENPSWLINLATNHRLFLIKNEAARESIV